MRSARIVQILENNGRGLNLTKEVRDGILCHGTSMMPSTLEGRVVRLADKIAYINHDIDDAIRGRIITEEDIPMIYRRVLGDSAKIRLDTLIHDVIENSLGQPDILMSEEIGEAMFGLRSYMFKSVYTNPAAKDQESKAQNMLRILYEHFCRHTDQMPEEFLTLIDREEPVEKVVCDYIAGMTDQYSIMVYEELYVPAAWKVY